MADIFSTISLVAFVLAGVCVIAAIALFFALNTKAAYLELKGQPQKKWVSANSSKKGNKSTTVAKPVKEQETLNTKMDDDDEAVTTLDSGETITSSLMSVYEPGTDIVDENTESKTDVETELATDIDEDNIESATDVEDEAKTDVEGDDIESATEVEDEAETDGSEDDAEAATEVEDEAQTDVGEDDTEAATEVEDEAETDVEDDDGEAKTEVETDPDSSDGVRTTSKKVPKNTAFKITKKVVIVHSSELLR